MMSFYIPETTETITAKHRPIVIITSNSEKELADPFLRRCIFHFIDFPEEDLMEEIVRVHYPDMEKKLMKAALKRFYLVRQVDALRKKPSTSELIDWIQALIAGGISPSRLEKEMPFVGTLLKKKEDLDTLQGGAGRHPSFERQSRTRYVY